MLYGILIIFSLAIIFIVLVRRLPELGQEEPQVKEVKKNAEIMTEDQKIIPELKIFDRFKSVKLPKFKAPAIKLPKIKLPKRQEKITDPMEIDADNFFKRGDLISAEELYLKIASSQPRNARAYNRLGGIYLQQKNYSDAKEAFSVALKIDSKVPSRHYNLALACIGLGDRAGAREAVKKALELEPNNHKYLETLESLK